MDKHKDFFLLERVPRTPIYIFSLADTQFVAKYFKDTHKLKVHPGSHLSIYEKGDLRFNYQLPVLRQCTRAIFEKLIANPHWGIEIDNLILDKSKLFFNYSKKISRLNLSKLTGSQLAKISDEWFFEYFHDSWLAGWPAVLVDFESNLFSNYLLDYLKQKTKKSNVSVGDVFSILTTPLKDTYAEKESISLLNLLSQIRQNKKLVNLIKEGNKDEIIRNWSAIDNTLWKKFNDHYNDYRWLPYMYIGPAWDMHYFLESLTSLLKQNISPQKEFNKIKKQKQQTMELQKKYLKDFHIHKDLKILFNVARKFVYSKSYRKDAMYYSCYVINKLLKEIARRKYMSIDQARSVYPWEIKDLLKGKGPNLNTLNARLKYAIQYSTEKQRITKEGDQARKLLKKFSFVKQTTKKPSTILGDCACVGKVRGLVKIINSPDDMAKMKQGNILLSYATSPDIMPAIKKAAAIVTDLGGIICHAAIVSRELKIPCVVGTTNATQALKDGDLIEVDATHGIVRLIKQI